MRKKFSRVLSWVLVVALLVPMMGTTVSAATNETQFDNFITVEGTKLMDGDKELKFVSLNYPQATSDTAWEHENAMKTIKAMGGNVTRTYTIPVWNGSNDGEAYVTGVDANGNLTFDDDALNKLDSVLAAANKYGIRVIIPFVDHWHWVGGIDGYVYLAGESGGAEPSNTGYQDWAWTFYSSEKCMDLFKQMITRLLNRRNTVTGVLYKDDPAILCWETGNELGNRDQDQRDQVLFDFTNKVVEHVKSIDQNHLVLDGRMSMGPLSVTAENKADILGAHYYEGNYAERCKNDTINAHTNAGKPFILGEFGAKIEAQPCIDVFEQGRLNDTNGIMMWSLRAHKDGYGYYFHSEDGYWASYHWPGFVSGDYYGETEILRSIYAYAQIANGVVDTYEEAKNIPIPAPETDEAPLLYADGEYHNSFKDGSVGDIKWRGVVGGAWYEIQRADGAVTEANAASANWTTIAGEEEYVYDSGRNWEDKSKDCIAGYHDETAVDGQTYSYRLRACNESGVGLWSNIVTVNNTKHVVVDELDLIAVSSDDPNPTEIRNTYSSDHSANITYVSSSVTNSSATEGYIEYNAIIPVTDVVVKTSMETEAGNEPKIFVSADGISYTELTVSHTGGTKEYSVSNASATSKYYYARVYIPGESACTVDSITITYQNDGNSYRTELDGAPVSSNVMIQDNTFGIDKAPYYTTKTSNMVASAAADGVTTGDDAEAQIIYKTADDINAYRVVAYAKDGAEPIVEYSYDGVTYYEADDLASKASGDYTEITYGNLNVTDTVRVIRVTIPAGSKDKVVLKSVELSSGTKTIPLSQTAAENVIEDGEYYFGEDANLEAAYTITQTGDTIVYGKDLGGVDFSEYDSLYAWVKPDTDNDSVYVDSVYVNLSTKVDDYESYNGSNSLLNAAYSRNTNGGSFDLSLDPIHKSEGYYGLKVDYNYNGTTYAGAKKEMDALNLSGYDGFTLYMESDGSGNQFKLQMQTDVSTFNYTGYLTGKGPMTYYIPFDDIVEADWTGGTRKLDATQNLLTVELYTNQEGPVTSGTFYVDDIKGANFVEALESQTRVSMNALPDSGVAAAFPYTISGTAEYVDYVSVTIGEKVFNVPVTDGNWEYDLTADSGIYNAEDVVVKAGFYYPNGDVVIESAEAALTIDVEGNDAPIVEEYDNLIWDWDFATDGTEGWTFEGFSPWEENGNLVAWSANAYDAVFSYTINDVPNGVYTLQNDIKVKNNMLNAQMALSDGTAENEVKTKKITTDDVVLDDQFMSAFDGEKLVVTNNTVVVKYYAQATDDANGSTFAVGDIKLYLAEGADLVKNGDFTTLVGEYPKYPAEWNVEQNGEYDAVKAQVAWFDEGKTPVDNSVLAYKPTTFELYQEVEVSAIDAGIYKMSADITLDNVSATNLVMSVKDSTDAVVKSLELANGICELTDIELAAGTYTVSVSGVLASGTVYIDDVSLVMTQWAQSANDSAVSSKNYLVNGDFSSCASEWPNLPNNWTTSYTGGQGWSPIKGADEAFVGYADAAYTFTLSQDVTGIPAGEYSLSADVTLNTAGHINSLTVSAGDVSRDITNEVSATVTRITLGGITVTDGTVTVSFIGDFPDKGVAIDNVVLSLVEEKVYLVNGDFSSCAGEWPNLPNNWTTSYTGGQGWSPIKGADEAFVGYADAAYTFTLSQDVTGVPVGVYSLSADVTLNTAGHINSFSVSAGDVSREFTDEITTAGTQITLDGITVTDGAVTVAFIGDFPDKGVTIDNVVMNFVEPVALGSYSLRNNNVAPQAEEPVDNTEASSTVSSGDVVATQGAGSLVSLNAESASNNVNILSAGIVYTLYMQLTDVNGRVWTSEGVDLKTAQTEMHKFVLDGNMIDLSQVAKFEFVIKASTADAFANAVPVIALDSENVYNGNYGVALKYAGEDYVILAGDNQTVTVGAAGELTIIASGSIEKFVDVLMDGKLVPKDCYDVEAGSTIITFHPDYVKTLTEGPHTITFVYVDGTVDANVNVKGISTGNTTTNPPANNNQQTGTYKPVAVAGSKTGDDNNIMAGVILLFAGLGVCAYMYCTRRKKATENE